MVELHLAYSGKVDILPNTIFFLRFIFIYFLRLYLFIHERERERGRDTGRGRSRLHAGSPMRDSIPELQDHNLNRRQTLSP